MTVKGFEVLADFKKKKRPKYGNRKTVIDGIEFDSAKEAKRYAQLKLLQRAGKIDDLELQPKFKLHCGSNPIKYPCGKTATYSADFAYTDTETGAQIVEDVKSKATAKNSTYRLKVAIVRAQYGIEVREV